jgi:dTDP-4-amino-4,6-dideoxygalactose transaminase
MSQPSRKIPIAKPYITDEEIEAVIRVLKSGILAQEAKSMNLKRSSLST